MLGLSTSYPCVLLQNRYPNTKQLLSLVVVLSELFELYHLFEKKSSFIVFSKILESVKMYEM